MPYQQWTRLISCATPRFTLAGAFGYLRPTSLKVAQAASFCLSAASDWPSRNSAFGALPECSYLVETARKDSRRVAIALALIQAFAQPILRVRHQPFVRIFFQEIAEGLFGQRVVLVQHIAVSEIVFVLRLGRRRQRRQLRAGRWMRGGGGGIGLAVTGSAFEIGAAGCVGGRRARRIGRERRQIERRAGSAAIGRADRRCPALPQPSPCAERARRARCVGVL